MGVLDNNTLLGASAASDYEIEQSLRFDDGRETYLSRTFPSAGNRKTWTYSLWFKRGNLGGGEVNIFKCYTASNDNSTFQVSFNSSDKLNIVAQTVSYGTPSQVFRDTSAWYHLVIAVDTTQGTANNRVKVYVNGQQVTSFSSKSNPSQNADLGINQAAEHVIGSSRTYSNMFDGYMGEVNFIDGQALTPDSFGETGKYGEWNPIKYAGTYGTNGFYLPFKQDYTVEGFSTVVWENDSPKYVGGVGFQSDLLWAKSRLNVQNHVISDAVTGFNGYGSTSRPNAFYSNLTSISPTADGFTSNTEFFTNGQTYVAWNWDMGGTTASNTSGTINSSVRANQAYGQSIVTYSANGSSGTIGHGLGAVPTMIIVKKRNASERWCVFHTSTSNAYIYLNETFAAETGNADDRFGNNTSVVQPTSSVFSVGQSNDVNGSSGTYVAYCFSDVAGYSKHGSFTGNNSTSNVITTGFAPAFVMIKNTESTYRWYMLDNTRDPNNPASHRLFANNNDVESTNSNVLEFTSTGFKIITTDAEVNQSGKKMLYMAFADTREYAYWLDQSGNNNDWTSEGGLTESDVMVDSPTNNFATWNPLFRGGESSSSIYASTTLSEGNLQASVPTNSYMGNTMRPQSGTWYSEFLVSTVTNEVGWGWINAPKYSSNTANAGIANKWGGYYHGYAPADLRVYDETSQLGSNIALTISNGDILQLAWDIDNNKGWIGINNTWYAADNGTDGNPSAGTNQTFTFAGTEAANLQPYVANGTGTAVFVANFGADSSFAGNKTPQGNQDAKAIGDFYYAPPTGFLALCTKSLPSVDVIPSENFNTVIYSGTNADNRVLSGVGFTPDLGIFKRRNGSGPPQFFDTLRGATKQLRSDNAAAESTQGNKQKTFTSDGYTLGTDAQINGSGGTYVAWNWKAGGSASSNSNGTITSQVSANVDAGFSIVTYTGTGSNATVGHGLSKAPNMSWIKPRNFADNWIVTYDAVDGSDDQAYLNLANAGASPAAQYAVAQNATTLGLTGWNNVNDANDTYVAYCFHSVESYSKVGSYVGNGNVDGPMVNLGFKPKLVIIKRITEVGVWFMFDTERSPYNVMNTKLNANSSDAEDSDTSWNIDFLSNGFKLRGNHVYINSQNNSHIFIAFAENPFKHSNAR